MPMHYLGVRRNAAVSQYTEVAYLQKLMPIHAFMTYAAIITIAAQFIFVINLSGACSRAEGERQSVGGYDAGMDDCNASANDNFGGVTPVVSHGPYEYGVPGAVRDYVMQTDPVTTATHESTTGRSFAIRKIFTQGTQRNTG